VLSAAPHGESAQIVAELLAHAEREGVRLTVVDASADFRFADAAAFAGVYGKPHATPDLLTQFTCAVPEQLDEIRTPHAAHPGCFATSMLLGIVPLLASGLAAPKVAVSAVTGSTGAGRTPRETTHHPVRQSNLFAYQPLAHRHQPEVEALTRAATGADLALKFVPHSGPFARGIHATMFFELAVPAKTSDVIAALADYYDDAPLVSVLEEPPRMKDIAGSCRAFLSARVEGDTAVVFSVIDNLLKGAAGGSVQWVNRLLGLPETAGIAEPSAGWL
jgi:N-acetyl-gamma-glutamyl-phosphate reductase